MNAILLARAAQKRIGSLARDGKADITADLAQKVRIRSTSMRSSAGLLYALEWCASDVSVCPPVKLPCPTVLVAYQAWNYQLRGSPIILGADLPRLFPNCRYSGGLRRDRLLVKTTELQDCPTRIVVRL